MFRQWKDGTFKMVLVNKTKEQDFNDVCLLERELVCEELSRGTKGFLQILDRESLTDRIRDFYVSRDPNLSATYIAREENAIGFVHGEIQNHPLVAPRRIGFVTSFFVAPEYRNKGVGRELYSEMENWFKEKGCVALELDVSEGNPAIKFYQGEGFEKYMIKLVKNLSGSN